MTGSDESATPNGWHVGISESKRGRFRPVLKFGETIRAVMPIGTWFESEVDARKEGDEILGIGVSEAYRKGHKDGAEAAAATGFAEGKAEAEKDIATRLGEVRAEAFANGRKGGMNAGTTRGFLWGISVTAILVVGGFYLAQHLGIAL